ncbi:MAG: hypothetical protein A3J74_08390 [Elusimicrobia bacterium RIFCSPHIGHO2_02_FULL_57_9]|nr:MAG: hypothetical protein A3J74_08390 [Elusimicrobia bacterium RIFCSPHIGHO2_02_FULL_57_9]
MEALEIVLSFFQKQGVEAFICGGDLVGYGPQPEQCLRKIRALKNLSVVCGNHDLAVIERMDPNWFNSCARAAVFWTRERLTPQSRRFLESLPGKIEHKEFSLVHGTPRKPPEEYLLSAAQFRENVSYVQTWPLFVGHSHIPLCFKLSGEKGEKVDMLFLEDGEGVKIPCAGFRAAPIDFNPGSVGQPRDHDPRASCALFDSKKRTFRIVRLDYDISSVQAKIRETELPEYLALRLAFGQ